MNNISEGNLFYFSGTCVMCAILFSTAAFGMADYFPLQPLKWPIIFFLRRRRLKKKGIAPILVFLTRFSSKKKKFVGKTTEPVHFPSYMGNIFSFLYLYFAKRKSAAAELRHCAILFYIVTKVA